MTIKELIEKLLQCQNQDANVHIILGDDDDDIFDTTDFEVFSDRSDDNYQDLFIHIDNLPDLKQVIENKEKRREQEIDRLCGEKLI